MIDALRRCERLLLTACVAAVVASCDTPRLTFDGEGVGDEGYAVVQDWPSAEAAGAMGVPLGVAADARGRVVIVHSGTPSARNADLVAADTVLVLEAEGGRVLQRQGAGLFATPHGVAVDQGGSIWVVDSEKNRVVVLDPEGRPARSFGTGP
jgi:DNA-binding beta-propeller fold protein YncE